jgi:hypothetical protein
MIFTRLRLSVFVVFLIAVLSGFIGVDASKRRTQIEGRHRE